MAVYATVADAQEIYGNSYIVVCCDRDNDGVLDLSSFEKHLQIASREMNAYLLGRYTLPLATPPEHFKKLCVDIAVYNAVPTADVRTIEMKDRYDSAIGYMKMVAKNEVKLEVADDTTAVNQSRAAETVNNRTLDLSLDTGSRVFTRRKMSCLF